MTNDDAIAPKSIGSDPVFHSAVMCAMHGDLSRLATLDGRRLRFAARSISVLIAGRVVQSAPCELAGFTFYPDTGVITFDADPGAQHDLVDLTIARMVAVDASALLAHDHGDATHAMWVDLWESVPLDARRRLAFHMGKKFTDQPDPCDTQPGDPHAAQ